MLVHFKSAYYVATFYAGKQSSWTFCLIKENQVLGICHSAAFYFTRLFDSLNFSWWPYVGQWYRPYSKIPTLRILLMSMLYLWCCILCFVVILLIMGIKMRNFCPSCMIMAHRVSIAVCWSSGVMSRVRDKGWMIRDAKSVRSKLSARRSMVSKETLKYWNENGIFFLVNSQLILISPDFRYLLSLPLWCYFEFPGLWNTSSFTYSYIFKSNTCTGIGNFNQAYY